MSALAAMFLALSAVVISVPSEKPQVAEAAIVWENYGYVSGYRVACTGSTPLWNTLSWGWQCPMSKGRALLSWCEMNPYTWAWEIRTHISNIEIYENQYGQMWIGAWGSGTQGWRSFTIDRPDAARAYCYPWGRPNGQEYW
jgi:hypothetical protein